MILRYYYLCHGIVLTCVYMHVFMLMGFHLRLKDIAVFNNRATSSTKWSYDLFASTSVSLYELAKYTSILDDDVFCSSH